MLSDFTVTQHLGNVFAESCQGAYEILSAPADNWCFRFQHSKEPLKSIWETRLLARFCNTVILFPHQNGATALRKRKASRSYAATAFTHCGTETRFLHVDHSLTHKTQLHFIQMSFNPKKASKIICLLRNYAKHAAELKNPLTANVVFFLKPPSSILVNSRDERRYIEIPTHCNADHEVELVAVIGKSGRDVKEENALDYVKGYSVGIDVTARNLQLNLKVNQHPWAEAKGFDTFLPICDKMLSPEQLNLDTAELYCAVNGEMRQKAPTSEMIYSVPEIIAAVSKVMTLEEDDLIMTGTPSGVGRLLPGDVLEAGVTGTHLNMEFGVKERETV